MGIFVNCSDIAATGWNFVPDSGQDRIQSMSSSSDIAGIGVVIGFSAAAYTTFLCVITYYLFGYTHSPYTNAIDHGCIDFLWNKVGRRPPKSWESVLRTAVLTYSDNQLVMGIGILTSAFPQLQTKLPSYYWQMVVYEAWFSSHTHLATLTVLRQHLRERPAIRSWRVILMVLTVLMLAVALLPTGDRYWMVDDEGHFIGGVPAICHYERLRHPSNFTILRTPGFTMVSSMCLLFFGYSSRILKISASATAFCRRLMRTKPGNVLWSHLDKAQVRVTARPSCLRSRLWYLCLEVMLVLSIAVFDAYESMLWEILWLFLALIWGSLHLFLARSRNLWEIRWQSAVYGGKPVSEDDNEWNFSQVFAVVILFLPLFQVAESFLEHRVHHQSQTMNKGPQNVGVLAASESPTPSHGNIALSTDFRKEDARKTPKSPLCVESPSTETSSPQNSYFNVAGNTAPSHTYFPTINPASRLLERPPQCQNYYDRQWFRLLVALIFAISLIEAAYGTYYSLLYDIEFAFLALLLSVTFSVVEVLLWAVMGGICMHVETRISSALHHRWSLSRRRADWMLHMIGWSSWIVMLAANVGLKVYLDTT